jgi:pyruvate/2-oxoglutarate dehydrogenase complex dihydrolipoamide dehydrogenase (E3) component
MEGVAIKEKAKVSRAEQAGRGVRLHFDNSDAIDGSHVLVAVGRRANLGGLGLEAAGVALESGRLKLDSRLRTTNKRIYAIGDAAGGLQFTHVAGDHASTLVRNILFKVPAKRRDHLAPRVTYSSPEIASIGLSEQEARAKYSDIAITRWPFADNDRARAEGDTCGFVKAILRKNGQILGAAIVGKDAGDQIGLWALAIANGLKVGAFTSTIAPYPTRGEASKRAAGAFYTPTLFSERTRRFVSLLSMFD